MACLKTIFIICMCCLGHGRCGSFNDSKTLMTNLLADYDINVRPVADQSQAVNVTIQAFIRSIKGFDEVQGKLSFFGGLLVHWHDVNMVWDPASYGGISETLVLYSNMWIPELILMTPAESVDSLGKKWHRIRFRSDGGAFWLPVDLIETTCSANVRNYPFDTQECEASFYCIGYVESEVILHHVNDEVDFSVYQENSVWNIKKSKIIKSEIHYTSRINLILFIDRKATFIILNVILPILVLNLLNVIVFLLIPESGERVSYAITVLLSIAVFMTIVSDLVPRSSEPVPIIAYKLMIDIVRSALIVLVTVLNLKWYYMDDSVSVPARVQSIYRALTCSCRKPSEIDNKSDRESKTTSRNHGAVNTDVKSITAQECDSEKVVSEPGQYVAEHNDRER